MTRYFQRQFPRLAIADIVSYGLADDYHTTFAERINSMTLEKINATARDVVRPNPLVTRNPKLATLPSPLVSA